MREYQDGGTMREDSQSGGRPESLALSRCTVGNMLPIRRRRHHHTCLRGGTAPRGGDPLRSATALGIPSAIVILYIYSL